jgi:alpha-tubulin suppressor-like RCC1 family protein
MKRLLAVSIAISMSLTSWPQGPVKASEGPIIKTVGSTISLAGGHVCAISELGGVRCWGSMATPPFSGLTSESVSQVSTSGHVCYILSATAQVRCLGSNTFGQLNIPSTLGKVTNLSAGSSNTCVITEAGLVRCWGGNSGQSSVPSDLGESSQVSSGAFHSCAVTVSGLVRCWGATTFGRSSVPADLDKASQISAGGYHTCALSEIGSVRCWGLDTSGQSTVPSDLGRVLHLSTGSEHTCALTENGPVRCWGLDTSGQSTVPSDLGVATQVSVGGNNSCAVTPSGSIRCWGANPTNQTRVPANFISANSFSQIPSPTISGKGEVGQTLTASTGSWDEGTAFTYQWLRGGTAIAGATSTQYRIQNADIGAEITLTLTSKKFVWVVTQVSNTVEITQREFVSRSEPIISGVSTVGSNLTVSPGIWDSGATFSFQWLRDGLEISGATSTSYTLQEIDDAKLISVRLRVEKIQYATVTVDSASVRASKRTFSNTSSPSITGEARVGSLLSASTGHWDSGVTFSYQWLRENVEISGATRSSYQPLLEDLGKQISVRLKGEKLTFNSVTKTSNPITISSVLPSESKHSIADGESTLATGSFATCAVLKSGQVFCAGDSRYGGNVPVTVGRSAEVSIRESTACAVQVDSLVKCWGKATEILKVPTNLGKTIKVAVGSVHACAISESDVLRCWGSNLHGQTQIPNDLGRVTQVSLGAFHTCAITIDSSVRCWGLNDFGQLLVTPYLGEVSKISAGYKHTCAVTIGGLVRCWGLNDSGQTAVPSDLGKVISLSSGYNHNCVITESETVKCWGSDNYDQSSVPVDIGKVTQISAGNLHSCSVGFLGKLVCWGANLSGQIAQSSKLPVSTPLTPSKLTAERVEGSSVFLKIDQEAQSSDDLTIWRIVDSQSKKTVCQVGDSQGCWVNNLVKGTTYTFTVTGSNDAGKTKSVSSSPWLYCPANPSISASPASSLVLNGSSVKISGSVSNLCFDAKQASFRYKATGKAWSTWTNHTITSSGQFSVTKKLSGNTTVQFQVKDGKNTVLQTKLLPIKVRIRYALPLSFSWKSAKNTQGFNQGGDITIKFTGDKEFNGTCTVLSETANAFNFALTPVGSESRFTQFKVLNGYGSGKVTMRWNGKATVGVLCKDPKFVDILDYRYATFKTNF